MKYFVISLIVGILAILIIGSCAPLKKLKCVDDLCVILEKNYWTKKMITKSHFYKTDIKSTEIKEQNGVDYLVIKTQNNGDIYLKFLHTPQTIFQDKDELSKHVNEFFMKLIQSNKDYESKWQRDIGALQIYFYGKPLFK